MLRCDHSLNDNTAKGLQLLAERASDALGRVPTPGEAQGGGAKGLEATGTAYVRFALANPALFRLIKALTQDLGV